MIEKLVKVGDHNAIKDNLVQSLIHGLGTSCECVGESNTKVNDVYTSIIVFQKYYLRTTTWSSLSLHLIGYNNKVKATIIGSGGGRGIFNIFYACESAFKIKL